MAKKRDFEKRNKVAKVQEHDRRVAEGFSLINEHEATGSRAYVEPSIATKAIRNAFDALREVDRLESDVYEAEKKLNKAKTKYEEKIRRRLEGEGAKDLVYSAKRLGMYDYSRLLRNEWRFDKQGNAMYSDQEITGPFNAEICDYVCLGFPSKSIERLTTAIKTEYEKTPNATLRIEQLLLNHLSRISTRKYLRVSDATIRQEFRISKRGRENAKLLWPGIYHHEPAHMHKSNSGLDCDTNDMPMELVAQEIPKSLEKSAFRQDDKMLLDEDVAHASKRMEQMLEKLRDAVSGNLITAHDELRGAMWLGSVDKHTSKIKDKVLERIKNLQESFCGQLLKDANPGSTSWANVRKR